MFAINFQVQESIHANGWKSLRYGLLNFKCLMTNCTMFDTQLDHVFTLRCKRNLEFFFFGTPGSLRVKNVTQYIPKFLV